MKKRILQPVLAIVALIVSVATTTLCIFAWFTSNGNNSGTFGGAVINPAVSNIEIHGFIMDQTAEGANTYTVGYRLGDEMPEPDPFTGNTRYVMRAFGSTDTTAILVEVKLTLVHDANIALISEGFDEYQTDIPESPDNEYYYSPYLSEAVAIFSGVTYDETTKIATFDRSTATAHYMVSDTTADSSTGTSKVPTTIYEGGAGGTSVTCYFVIDYHAPLMNRIFYRIDGTTVSGSGSLSATLDFNNDITFIATDV